MPVIEGLDPQLQVLLSTAFLVAVAVFAGWSHVFGRKTTPKPEVKEFHAAAQLADMGPVKELVEGQGLLIQQQVRTNLALEACAEALRIAATTYAGEIQAERDEAAFEAEVDRRLKKELDRERRARRRVVKRAPRAGGA